MKIIRTTEPAKLYITNLNMGAIFSFRNDIDNLGGDYISSCNVFIISETPGLDIVIINLRSGEMLYASDFEDYEIIEYKNATLTI